jgi:Protein of unknown function (DUF4232)
LSPTETSTRLLTAIRVGCGCAAAAALTAALGGCGSASPGRAGPDRPAVARCGIKRVRMILDTRSAGVAAGSSYIPIDFTNTSRARCRLAGYPAVSAAAGAAGRPVGGRAAADRQVRVTTVILPPGGTAHAWLQVLDALNLPASRCRPVVARWITVNLPGQRGPSYLAHRFPACETAPHGTALLIIHPFQPGRGRPGTAQ